MALKTAAPFSSVLFPLALIVGFGELANPSTANADSSASSAQSSTQLSKLGPGAPASLLFNQIVLRPTIGGIFFNESNEFSSGVLAEIPALQASNFVLSIASGFLYSGLGSSVVLSTGASYSVIQLPADLKLVVRPPKLPALSVGPHVGANWIHTSGGLNGAFGSSDFITPSAAGTSDSWDVHPNVGGDVDYSFSKSIEVSLRYDSTLMSGFNMQTLTLGLGIVI